MSAHSAFRHFSLALAALVTLSLACVSLGPAAVAAGNPPADSPKPSTIDIVNTQAHDAKLFTFDYGVPTSPALTLAGLSPDKTTTSTSLKPFVLSLPGLFDSSSGQTSAALDASIAWLLDSPNSAPQSAYQDDPAMRFEFRTRLGLALDRGADGGADPSKSKPSHIAFGLSVSLLDSSDPIMATTDPWAPAHLNVKTNRWNSVWDQCLDAPGGAMRPYIADQDNRRSIVSRDHDFVLRALRHAGGSEGRSASEDISALLTDDDKAAVRVAEGNLKLIAGDVAAGGDGTFTRQRLLDDQTAADTYINKQSPEEIAHDQKALTFINDCAKKASAAAQHNATLNLGLGAIWSGDGGKWSGFKDPNFAVWIAGRLPLGFGESVPDACSDQDKRSLGARLFSCWTIGGSGRYSNGQAVQTGVKATPQFTADITEGWIGLERLDPDSKLGGYFGYLDQRAVHAVDKPLAKSGTRWLISGAFNLSSIFDFDGLWVVGSYGAANGSATTLDDKVAMLTLSFGPPKIGSTFVDKTGGGSGGQ